MRVVTGDSKVDIAISNATSENKKSKRDCAEWEREGQEERANV